MESIYVIFLKLLNEYILCLLFFCNIAWLLSLNESYDPDAQDDLDYSDDPDGLDYSYDPDVLDYSYDPDDPYDPDY